MAVFLHTRIRVSDLDKSIQYYSEHFDFVLKSRSDKSPAGNQIAHTWSCRVTRTLWS